MNSEIETRQKRLQIMRERHLSDGEKQRSSNHTTLDQAGNAKFGTPLENSLPKSISGSGQNMLLQRILQFLERPDSGGRLLEGIHISEGRVQQLVNFLRARSQGNHPLAKRLRWILGQLEQVTPGEEQVAGVSIRQLQRFLSVARGGGDIGGRGMEMQGATSNVPTHPRDPLQEALPKLDSCLDALTENLVNMEEALTKLTVQFHEAQRELKVLLEWREALGQRPQPSMADNELVKSRRDAGKAEQEVADWFSDFLD